MTYEDFGFLGQSLSALNNLCGSEKTAPEVDVFVNPPAVELPRFTRRWLMKHKKLVLVFGVQQTLLDQSRDKQALSCIQDPDIHCVKLVSNIRSFCKLRTDLIDCLHMLQEKFVIGIYTTGSKEFGAQILKMLDPDSSLILGGCCEATTKFGERSLKTFAASLGEGDVELDSRLCIICDTDFNTWVIEDHQCMIPLEPYRYWHPIPRTKAQQSMWPTTKLLLDLHELFFDKYNRKIASKHLIREVIGKANGITMLKSFCAERKVNVKVTSRTENSVTVLITCGNTELEYNAKNELDAINQGSRKFLVQLTGAAGWKGLQKKSLVRQPEKKQEIRRMKELMNIQKTSNLYKTALSPPPRPAINPISPRRKKRTFAELLEQSGDKSSTEGEFCPSSQTSPTNTPNRPMPFSVAPSRSPVSSRSSLADGILSPQKGLTSEVSQILSLSAPPRGIHLPKKKVVTPRMLLKQEQTASRTHPLPTNPVSPPVATKSTRTNAKNFNDRNKRHLEESNSVTPAAKRRKVPHPHKPTDLLNYSTKEHLLHTADFGKGPRKILSSVGPKRYDYRGCIQSKKEQTKGTHPDGRPLPIIKKSIPHSRTQSGTHRTSSYDNLNRGRPVPAPKYSVKNMTSKKSGTGIIKYSIPRQKPLQGRGGGSYPNAQKAPHTQKVIAKVRQNDHSRKRPPSIKNIPTKPSSTTAANSSRSPLARIQPPDLAKRQDPAKRLPTTRTVKPSTLPKRLPQKSKLEEELFGGSISDDSDDSSSSLDTALHVIKRKKEAEKTRQLMASPDNRKGLTSVASPDPRKAPTSAPPMSARKGNPPTKRSQPQPTFTQSNSHRMQPSKLKTAQKSKEVRTVQQVKPTTPSSTRTSPKRNQKTISSESASPQSQVAEIARAKWPVPRAQQKFYPDYPPSQYYTFHPMYGNERCGFCQKEKPSPSLLLCDRCRDPPATMESSFCIKCGKFKHPADFKEGGSDVCLSCSGMQVCKRCQNEGDARWFPKVLWKKDGKDAYCFACLGNFVQCPQCCHWRHRSSEPKLSNCCICHS